MPFVFPEKAQHKHPCPKAKARGPQLEVKLDHRHAPSNNTSPYLRGLIHGQRLISVLLYQLSNPYIAGMNAPEAKFQLCSCFCCRSTIWAFNPHSETKHSSRVGKDIYQLNRFQHCRWANSKSYATCLVALCSQIYHFQYKTRIVSN